MSFNLRYDNPNDNENSWQERELDVVSFLKYYHPDILGIQEGLHNQVEFILQNSANYNYIGVGRDDGKQKGEYSAIYFDTTKLELISNKTFWLSETPNKISVGWDASMERICTYGVFKHKKTKKVIHVFNTHFDHIGIEARKNSAQLIIDKIIELKIETSKLIVMGDLNSEPESEAIKILEKGLTTTTTSKFYGPTGTFNGFEIDKTLDKRIDYIFTKNLAIINYRHIDDRRQNNLWISDHLPILAKVDIK
ncbi:endonuclease/exonuclease/phosphatase family protein [Tenacibaculum adriaticum]|nr:endonuclease/exonuclease/phosphatase family protein [Tenacibaculum adriaticum]